MEVLFWRDLLQALTTISHLFPPNGSHWRAERVDFKVPILTVDAP